jgi:hypothetical protein
VNATTTMGLIIEREFNEPPRKTKIASGNHIIDLHKHLESVLDCLEITEEGGGVQISAFTVGQR